MANFENNLNIIERANKVLTFRKYIREECRKKGLEYPSDDKIAEWVDQNYGWSVEDFMADYTEKEGIFRDPINDFISKVNSIEWAKKPTEDEIKAFFEKSGDNINLFCQERTIAEMKPLEKATLLATLKLSDMELVLLWNQFIKESALYGEDSYIYDLTFDEDVYFLKKNMNGYEFNKIVKLAKENNTKYVQWFVLNGGDVKAKTDIKGIIVAYWGEIFERIMGYPMCYNDLDRGQFSHNYFEDTFWNVVINSCGYTFDERNAKLSYAK